MLFYLQNIAQGLKKGLNFIKTFLFHSIIMLYNVAIYIPLIHILNVLDQPSSIFQTLIIGPIVGIAAFLLNPKSLIAGSVVALAASFGFPALPLNYLLAVGLGANTLFGFFESVVTRINNQSILRKATIPGQGMLNYYGRKEIVAEKFPHGLGPIPRGLYYNFLSANICSTPGYRPNRTEELYHMPETIAGLKPI